MTRSTRSNFLLAIASLAGALLAAEIVLRIAAPVVNPIHPTAEHAGGVNPYIRFEYPKGYAAVTVMESGVPDLAGRHFFTTNAYGFRGDSLVVPKPAREVRIFVVGGSTPECFYLDDADDMSRIAQGDLATAIGPGAKIYNVGLSGTASDDHVAMISQRLVHLEPDAIVVFAGLNDVRRSLQGFDYLHYTSYSSSTLPLYKRVLLKSQLGRRLAYFTRRVDPHPGRVLETRTLESDYWRKIAVQHAATATDAVVRVDAASYRDNLRTIAGMAHAHRFHLVFVTHPSTWNSAVDPTTSGRQWMRVYDGVVYGESAMDAALESLNDVMRAVAAEDSVPLYDLAREILKSTEYFYDDCHFNRAGARFAGLGLARFMAERVFEVLREHANAGGGVE